jgi:hypothetical protein
MPRRPSATSCSVSPAVPVHDDRATQMFGLDLQPGALVPCVPLARAGRLVTKWNVSPAVCVPTKVIACWIARVGTP